MTAETVSACPFCGDSSIVINGRSDTGGQEHRCTGCCRKFDDPVTREPEGHTKGRRGLAGELVNHEGSE